MQNFSIEKKGYSKDEVQKTMQTLVEDYESKLLLQRNRINELKQELEGLKTELNSYKNKDKNISGALIAAVETAQEIEKNSKNIYELEIKKLRLLYSKWENFLNEMLLKYPDMKENFDPQVILTSFQESIDKTMEENFSSMRVTKRGNNEIAREGIQSLLNKMNATSNKIFLHNSSRKSIDKLEPINIATIRRQTGVKEESIERVKAKNDFKENVERLNDGKSAIRPITNLTLSKEDEYDNLVDKYLIVNNIESEQFANNAYAKQLTKKRFKKEYPSPNETGFDLKQALSPTEELSEIMKAFDFFNQDDDK